MFEKISTYTSGNVEGGIKKVNKASKIIRFLILAVVAGLAMTFLDSTLIFNIALFILIVSGIIIFILAIS